MFLNSVKRFPNRKQIEIQFDRAAATYDSVAAVQRQMGILSSNMIAIARGKSPAVDFLKAPLESIPVGEAEFDIVISNAAIQWCETEVASAEIDRVLKPGGSLFLNTFVQGTLSQWGTAFEQCGLQPRVQPLPSGEDIETMFAAADFEALQVQQCTETSSFDSIDDMFSSIRKLGATNATASRQKPVSKSEYLALKNYFELQLESNGKLELDFVWIEVCAKKMAWR